MEYEKTSTATSFSRKISNRSHSLSFSANAVYDGVFASPVNTRSPLVDYGEIFRGSGPSPSSIPFLDVPELNVGKVKVDVRSSKLDYSSVFGGFGACDFAVTPKEVIIKSERKTAINEDTRNLRKCGNSSDVRLCNKAKNQTSSPEMVRLKHSDILHQTSPRNENKTTHLTQVRTMSGPTPTQLVDNMSPFQNTESKTPIPSVEKKPCNQGVEEVKASRKQSSKTEVDFEKIFGRSECSMLDNSTCKTDSNAEHWDVKPPSSLQHTFNSVNGASKRIMGSNSGLSESFQSEDADSPSSPPFFDAETDENSFAAESSAALKKAIEEAQVRMNIAKQMMERKKSGFRSSAKLKSFEDPKVENKRDRRVEGKTEESRENISQILGEMVNSSELKSCENPKVENKRDRRVEGKTEESRENISQILGETLNSSELKSFEDPKVENKRDGRVEGKTEESRENNSQILGEMVNSSEQSFSNDGDQHAKRARKMWEVPEGLLKSISDHKQEDVEGHEEEQARRTRKHWELPGGIFKSVMNSKQQEPENLPTAKPESDTKQEVQPLTENPFYTFGQLGSKIKCVVEAFMGSKVTQKDETHVTEKEDSIIPQIVEGEESDSQEMCTQVMETYIREVEETLHQTESKSETKVEEKTETKMCTFTEGVSQMMEKESAWKTKSAYESDDGPKCGVKDFQEYPDPTYNFLDHEGEKEIVSEPQEMFVAFDDTKTYLREVEEIPTPVQSITQFDERVGTMVSLVTENTPEPRNIEEKEHKAPRQRRVWKTSEDVYNMIKAPKGNSRPWQLERVETETTHGSFQREGVRIYDASEETESTSEQASDSGLQENWTVLKQMFRQMFQTADTIKEEDETYCLLESEEEHIDIHQKAGDDDGKETADTSYCQMTGTDKYEQNKVETVETEYEAYAHTRETEDLESAQEPYRREVQGKTSFVRELIGEELEANGMATNHESEEVGWAQGFSEFDEIKEYADSRAEMLEYDRSETDSNKSGEKLEQTQELPDETKIDDSIDTDTSRSSFEMRHGDSCIEEVGVEQDLSDHEKNSGASKMEEQVEEIDSDSIQSSWSAVEDDDKIKSYVKASKPEEMEETTKEETDEMKTSLGVENNEDEIEQKHLNAEPAESCLLKEDEKIGAGDESCRSSMEEGDATSDTSQNEAEKHLKKKNEAKEKERERVMVERAIREARERAFADAKERAGKAALEKAKAGAPRRGTSEVPRKGSVEVKDKLSSAEKAKLRAERAAVERALFEARERALEKALSSKSASQTRSYGGSKSFSSSSSGTESKTSGPYQTGRSRTFDLRDEAKGEQVQRCKAKSERHQRTSEALTEKNLSDLKAQKEQAERNKLTESLDADVKRWSNGKENNLRALLSTLQYILEAESGWKPIPLTDLVSSASVRKAYRKATLYVHPDKLQQRGASTQQKYICEKVFDLLKEAWNKFAADER